MPKLPTFTATVADAPIFAGRRATAQDFGAPGLGETGLVEAGHRVTSVAKAEIADMEESEARAALVKSTEVRAAYARKLDEAALSGGDLTKLKEEMANDLAKIGESFQTKKGSEQLQLYAANSEIMYDQQANAIKVQRAWSEARVQGQSFVNNASALIQSNPAYLGVAEKNVEDFVATFPNIRPDQRAELTDRLKKDLNMASAVSAARINPEDAKKRLEAGEWNLEPGQRSTAIDKAETEIRAKRAEESYLRAEKERERREQSSLARDEHFKKIFDGGFSRRAVMDDPRLIPQEREHLITLAEARAKASAAEEKRSDPAVVRDLYMRAIAPEGTPGKLYTMDAVYEAVKSGAVNPTDAQRLNAVVAQQRDENGRSFSQRLHGRLTVLSKALNESPEYKNQPELSSAIQLSLVSQVEKKSNEMRAKGESPDNLLNPDSKDYFFKPGLLKATADAVRQEQAKMQLDGAVRVTSVQQALAVKDGQTFLDDSGVPKVMTPAIRQKLSAPVKPVAGSATEFLDPLFKAIDNVLAGKVVGAPPAISVETRKYWAAHDKAALERWDLLYGAMNAVLQKDVTLMKPLPEAARKYWAAHDKAALERWDAMYKLAGGK